VVLIIVLFFIVKNKIYIYLSILGPTETLSVPTVLPRSCTVTVAQLCYCDTLLVVLVAAAT